MAKIIDLDIILPLIVEPVRPNLVEVGTPVVTNIGSTSFDVEQTFSSDVDYYGGIYVGETSSNNDDATLVKNPGYLNKKITGLLSGTTYYLNGVALPVMGNISLGNQIAVTTKSSPIPSEYQLVEYLESDGGQYIDTDVLNNIYLEFSFENVLFSQPATGEFSALFGVYTSQAQEMYIQRRGDNQQLMTAWNGIRNYFTCKELPYEKIIYSTLNGHFFVKLENDIVVDRNISSSPASLKIYLFRLSGNATNYFKGQCYSCWIYNGTDYLRKFYSVYRKSDNKPGMYDIVNNQFYVNQGTGEFIVGQDKEWEE